MLRLKQQGITVIMLLFIVGLAAAAYLMHALSPTMVRIEQQKKSGAILSEARAVLIGYALSRVNAGTRPGDFPYPDRLLTPAESPPAGGPPNYDGSTDSCVITGSGATTKWTCLGRLPWKDIGLAIQNPSENDPVGIMPWYAVSANLLDICLKEFNPGILNYPNPDPNTNYYPAVCPGTPVTGILPHPWITVRDKLGNVISNRVAAVILIPGVPVGSQTRPVSPNLGGAAQYLDTVTVTNSAQCTATHVAGTYSNADSDNDFIMADDMAGIPLTDPCYQQPYQFNDKLIYITIDELMSEIVKRAAGEGRSLINNYYAKNAHFPYAASLGSAVNNYISSGASASGMLPVDGTDNCTCVSSNSCKCGYSLVGSVAHTRTSGGSYTINSGLCSLSGRTCTCTGVGQCRNASGSRTFNCIADGTCTFLGTATSPLFTYTPQATYGNIASAFNGCSLAGSNVVCNAAGNFYVGLNVPLWFRDNLWQEYFYYHQSSAFDLQVGIKTGVGALLVGAGNIIVGTQTRPSNNVGDYLDSVENTNLDKVYDAVGTLRTSTYNDQMFIVAP